MVSFTTRGAQLLTPALVVTATNFAWFALVFRGFLAMKSVISTSTIGGLYLVMGRR